MAQYNQPTKRQIRLYLEERHGSKEPPPSPEEVRRRLGWDLIEQARKGTQRR